MHSSILKLLLQLKLDSGMKSKLLTYGLKKVMIYMAGIGCFHQSFCLECND